MVCYKGLRFLQRAVVLLELESDAACTNLSGYFARIGVVSDSLWCYNAIGDRERNFGDTDRLNTGLTLKTLN